MPATCSTEEAWEGFRAPDVPGAGIHFDYGLASFDIRNVFHFSGGYELPFGKGKRYMASSSGVGNVLASGWSVNWSATLQGGQPITLPCPSGTANGTGCYDLLVKGQSPKLGLHTNSNGELSWIGNPAAFSQPCKLVAGGVPDPTSIRGMLSVNRPGRSGWSSNHRFRDLPSTGWISRSLKTSSSRSASSCSSVPSSSTFSITRTSTLPDSAATALWPSAVRPTTPVRTLERSALLAMLPYDPRQIQFALKLYF